MLMKWGALTLGRRGRHYQGIIRSRKREKPRAGIAFSTAIAVRNNELEREMPQEHWTIDLHRSLIIEIIFNMVKLTFDP